MSLVHDPYLVDHRSRSETWDGLILLYCVAMLTIHGSCILLFAPQSRKIFSSSFEEETGPLRH